MAVLRSELKTVSKNEESHYIIKNFIRSEKSNKLVYKYVKKYAKKNLIKFRNILHINLSLYVKKHVKKKLIEFRNTF